MWDRPEAVELDDALDDTDLAQIIYTSGTTGAPKGAMMTHRAYLAEYAAAAHALDYSASDRALAALPLYHTAQLHAQTMPHLLVGAETLLIEAPEPALVLRLIEEQRITAFFAPPTVWISLLRHDDFSAGAAGTTPTPAVGAVLSRLRPEREDGG